MSIQSRSARMFLSPLAAWLVALAVSSYFLFTFDKKTLSQAQEETGIWGTIKKYYGALKLKGIKKGIDLEGGTYLVYSVEIEKALEGKLNAESRSLDAFLKNKDVKTLPTKKVVKNLTLELTFPSEESAAKAYNVLKEGRGQTLHLKRDGTQVSATLSPEVDNAVRTGAVEQTISVLNNRLGGYGVEGIVVQQHGEREIVIQLPGIDDPEHVKSAITKTAHLEFKIVEKSGSNKEALLDEFDGELPSDKMIVPGKKGSGEDDETAGRWYLVSAYPDLTGDHLTSAQVDHDEFHRPQVTFKMDSAGAHEFADITANNIGRQLGIIIDNVMITSPKINTSIPGGSGSITGIGSAAEAFDLAVVLRSGSLQAPLKLERENRVGASLGQDSINKGMMSCAVALMLLFIFSLIYYKIPGLLAILTLICNIFLTLLFLSYFKATLTLPGIAGIVLTIGMAIDASILIYERVKEELAMGVPLRKSILDGFDSAMSVILDSNITTFLTGIVLFHFGGPAIKGFAVTLMAGIIATVLTGVYFLKALFLFLTDQCGVKKLKF